eukprot:m.79269 g.79269  ORF g.79269 m.79269 type:complete len:824 (+) comp16266_c0_seq24:108-2579(+)
MTSLSATLTDEAEACLHTANVVDAEEVYTYSWQRPSDAYRERLAARRQELRELDLDTDDELLAEWFALLAEVDRLVREEHLLGDNLAIRSCAYYKEVLLARQAELRGIDLQSNHTLLIEWYALIKELDAVVKQQAIAERIIRQRAKPVDTRIRDGELQPCNRITVQVPGGTAYTAVSRRRPRAQASPSGETKLQNLDQSTGTDGSNVHPTASDQQSAEDGRDMAEMQQRSSEQEVYDKHRMHGGHGEVDGGDDDAIAAFDAEIAGTNDAEAHNAGPPLASLTLEDYALLPPDERFRALTTQISTTCSSQAVPVGTEQDEELDTVEDDAEEGWMPPTLDDVAASSLPDWLTGDADLVNDMCGADGDTRPLWDLPSDEIDLSQITELDLERQLAEKDEEIRLTQEHLELDEARRRLEHDRQQLAAESAAILQAVSGDGTDGNDDVAAGMTSLARAQLHVEEDELDLACREKELLVGELEQDIRDMDEELGKARLGMLQHPNIGEILDRASIMSSLESMFPHDGESVAVLDAVAVDLDASKAGTLSHDCNGVSGTIVPFTPGALAPTAVNDVQRQMTCDAAVAGDIRDKLQRLRAAAEDHARQHQKEAPDEVSGDVPSAPSAWHEQQLATIRTAAHSRQQMLDATREALKIADAGKEDRAELYTQKAREACVDQIRALQRRISTSQIELQAAATLRAEDAKARAKERHVAEQQLLAYGDAVPCGHLEQLRSERKVVRLHRLAEWDDRVAMLQRHLEEKLKAIKKLNKMASTFTGKDTLALNTYEQVSHEGGRVRKWRLKQAMDTVDNEDTAHASAVDSENDEPSWM